MTLFWRNIESWFMLKLNIVFTRTIIQIFVILFGLIENQKRHRADTSLISLVLDLLFPGDVCFIIRNFGVKLMLINYHVLLYI